MHIITGKSDTGRHLTEEEIMGFLAIEKETVISLVPEEKYLDYTAVKIPQNFYRVMASYREFSLFKYILDPIKGANKITESWKKDIQFFTVRAIGQILKRGIHITQKETDYLFNALSSDKIQSSLFYEVLKAAFYLPKEDRDRFEQALRMASYSLQ